MVEFILYVKNQDKSTLFYQNLLNISPSLHVPGMTEFMLNENCKLGLMPEHGIAKIIATNAPHPETGNGIPRCELYLKFKNAKEYFERGISLGAVNISPMQTRNWGDSVGYIADSDGHIIAFAEM